MYDSVGISVCRNGNDTLLVQIRCSRLSDFILMRFIFLWGRTEWWVGWYGSVVEVSAIRPFSI